MIVVAVLAGIVASSVACETTMSGKDRKAQTNLNSNITTAEQGDARLLLPDYMSMSSSAKHAVDVSTVLPPTQLQDELTLDPALSIERARQPLSEVLAELERYSPIPTKHTEAKQTEAKQNETAEADHAEVQNPEPSLEAQRMYYRARMALKAGRVGQGLQLLQQAVQLAPNQPELLSQLGQIYGLGRNQVRARFFLTKALERDPTRIEDWFLLANYWRQPGSERAATLRSIAYYQQALDTIDQLTQQANYSESQSTNHLPHHSEVIHALSLYRQAQMLQEAGQLSAAQERLRAFLNHPEARQIASLHTRDYETLLDQRWRTWMQLGDLHIQLGEIDSAAEAYDQASQLQVEYGVSLAERKPLVQRVIFTLLKLDEPGRAVRLTLQSLEHHELSEEMLAMLPYLAEQGVDRQAMLADALRLDERLNMSLSLRLSLAALATPEQAFEILLPLVLDDRATLATMERVLTYFEARLNEKLSQQLNQDDGNAALEVTLNRYALMTTAIMTLQMEQADRLAEQWASVVEPVINQSLADDVEWTFTNSMQLELADANRWDPSAFEQNLKLLAGFGFRLQGNLQRTASTWSEVLQATENQANADIHKSSSVWSSRALTLRQRLAEVYLSLGEIKLAETLLQPLIAGGSLDSDELTDTTRLLLLKLLAADKRLDEAIAGTAKLKEALRSGAEVQTLVGDWHAQQGAWPQAITAWKQALTQQPTQADLYDRLLMLLAWADVTISAEPLNIPRPKTWTWGEMTTGMMPEMSPESLMLVDVVGNQAELIDQVIRYAPDSTWGYFYRLQQAIETNHIDAVEQWQQDFNQLSPTSALRQRLDFQQTDQSSRTLLKYKLLHSLQTYALRQRDFAQAAELTHQRLAYQPDWSTHLTLAHDIYLIGLADPQRAIESLPDQTTFEAMLNQMPQTDHGLADNTLEIARLNQLIQYINVYQHAMLALGEAAAIESSLEFLLGSEEQLIQRTREIHWSYRSLRPDDKPAESAAISVERAKVAAMYLTLSAANNRFVVGDTEAGQAFLQLAMSRLDEPNETVQDSVPYAMTQSLAIQQQLTQHLLSPELEAQLQRQRNQLPDAVIPLHAMGVYRYLQGEFEQARVLLEQASQTSTGRAAPQVHDALGDVYDRLGQPNAAVRHWQLAQRAYRYIQPTQSSSDAVTATDSTAVNIIFQNLNDFTYEVLTREFNTLFNLPLDTIFAKQLNQKITAIQQNRPAKTRPIHNESMPLIAP